MEAAVEILGWRWRCLLNDLGTALARLGEVDARVRRI